MKLLIAYDGSKDADAAIDDLPCSGLPPRGTAEVLSIAEVWLPPPGAPDTDPLGESEYLRDAVSEAQKKGERAVAEAEILAKFGADRVRNMLPSWDVRCLASYGSPGWQIIQEADDLGADLIVVGAQGHSFLSRVVLGSISQRVLTEADCSVRIGRGRIDLDPGPQRIIVGFDGSPGSIAAVRSVSRRPWVSGTEVRLIAVTDPMTPTAIGRFVTPITRPVADVNVSERAWLDHSAGDALRILRERGLAETFDIKAGNPKQVLIEEAERFGADSIFLGANKWSGRFERLLLGSTSGAVAARAHCSVEVVRSPLNASMNGAGREVVQ